MKIGQVNLSYIGTQYQTPKGGTLTVIGESGRRRGKNIIWDVECSICSQDKELFPAPFAGNKFQLDEGQCPCACSTYRYTEEQNKIRLSRSGLTTKRVLGKVFSVEDGANKVCYSATATQLLKGYKFEPIIPRALQVKIKTNESENSSRLRAKEFKSEFFKHTTENGLSVVGEYKNASSKVALRCNEGCEFSVQPKQLKFSGWSCTKCNNSAILFSKKIDDICESLGYKILTRNNRTSPSKIQCSNGHVFSIHTENLTDKHTCNQCEHEERKGLFFDIVRRDGFALVGDYVSSSTPIKAICNKGHDTAITPSRALWLDRCPCATCAGKNNILSKIKFEDKCRTLNFKILGGYKSTSTLVDVECSKCHIFGVTNSGLNMDTKCKKCEIDNLTSLVASAASSGGMVLVRSPKEHLSGKFNFKCSVGHEFSKSGNNFLRRPICPICNSVDYRVVIRAKEKGLKIIGDIDPKSHHVKVKCQKGHVTMAMKESIYRTGAGGCKTCSNYGYNDNQKGFLYILVCEEGFRYKVGISNYPQRRIRDLKSKTPFGFNVLSIFNHDNGRVVREAEKAMHKMFESANLSGFDGCTEWLIADGSIIDVPPKMGLKY